MFSHLACLMNRNVFFVSRQKVLLKKRKITSKKQKVAKKKFIELNPDKSYTNELKILQIQKQMDKKGLKNHHLNQLMDELFYPDVRYANQQILQQNLLKISLNPSENVRSKKFKAKISEKEGESEQLQEYDQLIQQIYLCQIPAQLFQLYRKNGKIFTHEHLTVSLNRLKSYFKNKQKIEQRVIQKWKQSLDKLKMTDVQKKKRKRCPYVFIEQQDLIRDEEWNFFVKDINKKIQVSSFLIANQSFQQKDEPLQIQNVRQQQVVHSFISLQNNCDLALLIYTTAGFIPEEMFNSIVKKSFTIIDLNKNGQKSQEKLPIFTHQEKVKLLRVLSFKSKTKSTLTKSLYIESPQNSEIQEQSIVGLGKKLCQDILKSSECSSADLGAIIRSGKGYYKFLNSNVLNLSKPVILKYLSSTNLQRSIDYLYAFWLNGTTKDMQLIQILIFDIYRKLPNSFSKPHLFFLISFMKNNQIIFRQSEMAVNISQVYPRVAETVTKYMNRGELTHDELKTFLDSIQQNYPIYKAQHMINTLQMVSTTIVKIGEGFKLEQLGQSLFKIAVMGHKSRIFSKYVFGRYQKQYRKLKKQYRQSRTQLITDKQSGNDVLPNNEIDDMPSLNQILLEESLIMMLWTLVASHKVHNSDLPLNDMLEIFPLNCQSQDQMISDLVEDLNLQLVEFNLFPKIKNSAENKTRNDKRKSFKSMLLFKTNTANKYRYVFNISIVEQVMQKLQGGVQQIGQQSLQNLVDFVIRYCLKQETLSNQLLTNTILPNRWNDSVRQIYGHRDSTYLKMREQFYKNCQNLGQEKEKNVISQRLATFMKTRSHQMQASISKSGSDKFRKAQVNRQKLYELL